MAAGGWRRCNAWLVQWFGFLARVWVLVVSYWLATHGALVNKNSVRYVRSYAWYLVMRKPCLRAPCGSLLGFLRAPNLVSSHLIFSRKRCTKILEKEMTIPTVIRDTFSLTFLKARKKALGMEEQKVLWWKSVYIDRERQFMARTCNLSKMLCFLCVLL